MSTEEPCKKEIPALLGRLGTIIENSRSVAADLVERLSPVRATHQPTDDKPAICKQCRRPIDQVTKDWIHDVQFRLGKTDRPPTICGRCLVDALNELSLEVTGKPLFGEGS